ncbi:MAG: hypothetical protein ACRDUA_16755, partial [Micromonosporaceae bacterium]
MPLAGTRRGPELVLDKTLHTAEQRKILTARMEGAHMRKRLVITTAVAAVMTVTFGVALADTNG